MNCCNQSCDGMGLSGKSSSLFSGFSYGYGYGTISLGAKPRACPERSRMGICSSAGSSWKCFSTEESWACGPPKVMKNAFCSATALYGSVALPFVIPSGGMGLRPTKTHEHHAKIPH